MSEATMNIEAERHTFERVHPVPRDVVWAVKYYTPKGPHTDTYGSILYQATWNGWLSRAAQDATRITELEAKLDAAQVMGKLVDELCEAVDREANDIGGCRGSLVILRELGPAWEKFAAFDKAAAPTTAAPACVAMDATVEPSDKAMLVYGGPK